VRDEGRGGIRGPGEWGMGRKRKEEKMLKRYRTVFGEEVLLTNEKWNHVAHRHPEAEKFIEKVKEVLSLPDVVKLSKRDPSVHLYYKFYNGIYDGKYLLVVTDSVRKLISTIFITDKIKVGEIIWPGK